MTGRTADGWQWRYPEGHGASGPRRWRRARQCRCGGPLRLAVAHSPGLYGRLLLVCDAGPVTVAVELR